MVIIIIMNNIFIIIRIRIKNKIKCVLMVVILIMYWRGEGDGKFSRFCIDFCIPRDDNSDIVHGDADDGDDVICNPSFSLHCSNNSADDSFGDIGVTVLNMIICDTFFAVTVLVMVVCSAYCTND